MELNEIIEGCYENNRKHQEALYNLYAAKMLGVCLTYTKDRDLAQDILHDGFFKVFKSFISMMLHGVYKVGLEELL